MPCLSVRSRWHKECLDYFEVIGKGMTDQRVAYWRFHRLKPWQKLPCGHCGTPLDARECELDHIEPLKLSHARGITAFTPQNLQPLCEGCHKAKTAQDMKAIAAARRAHKTDPLFGQAHQRSADAHEEDG